MLVDNRRNDDYFGWREGVLWRDFETNTSADRLNNYLNRVSLQKLLCGVINNENN
jgi:hypothetical protein